MYFVYSFWLEWVSASMAGVAQVVVALAYLPSTHTLHIFFSACWLHIIHHIKQSINQYQPIQIPWIPLVLITHKVPQPFFYFFSHNRNHHHSHDFQASFHSSSSVSSVGASKGGWMVSAFGFDGPRIQFRVTMTITSHGHSSFVLNSCRTPYPLALYDPLLSYSLKGSSQSLRKLRFFPLLLYWLLRSAHMLDSSLFQFARLLPLPTCLTPPFSYLFALPFGRFSTPNCLFLLFWVSSLWITSKPSILKHSERYVAIG